MSKKIKEQQESKEKKVILDDYEMIFLRDLDTVQNSFNFYYTQLKTNYLQGIVLKLGYSIEDKLEFSIDLKDETKELTIKKLN